MKTKTPDTDSKNSELTEDAMMDNETLNEKKADRKMDELDVPDGGWGWVVCLSSFACNFLASGINVSAGILLVGLLQTFNESVTKTSLVLAMMNGVSMMISPLVSGFLSFFSHRQIIIAGSLLGAISTFASAFVTSIDLMIFTFGFMGVSQQNEVSDSEKMALAEPIDDEKEDMLKKQQLETNTEKDLSTNIHGCCMAFGKFICNILDFSSLKNAKAIMLVITFFLWSANQVVMLYLPFYCISIGMSTTDGAILMSIIGIGLTIGELIIGIFLDIFHIKSDHLMTFSLICMGLTTLAIPLLYDLYAIGALITIWSIAVGFGVSLRVLLIVELLGVENLAPVYSFVMFSNGLGYGVFPPIFGWVYDQTKSFLVIFNMTAAFFFISLIFTFIINYQLKKRTSQSPSHRAKQLTEKEPKIK